MESLLAESSGGRVEALVRTPHCALYLDVYRWAWAGAGLRLTRLDSSVLCPSASSASRSAVARGQTDSRGEHRNSKFKARDKAEKRCWGRGRPAATPAASAGGPPRTSSPCSSASPSAPSSPTSDSARRGTTTPSDPPPGKAPRPRRARTGGGRGAEATRSRAAEDRSTVSSRGPTPSGSRP